MFSFSSVDCLFWRIVTVLIAEDCYGCAGTGCYGWGRYISLFDSTALPILTSDQARIPAELKHISKRRKRN